MSETLDAGAPRGAARPAPLVIRARRALARALAATVPFLPWRVERRVLGRAPGRGGPAEWPGRVTPSGSGGAAA